MIAADTQSHQEPGEPDFVTREENAGYALNGAGLLTERERLRRTVTA